MPYMTRDQIIAQFGIDPGEDDAQFTFVNEQKGLDNAPSPAPGPNQPPVPTPEPPLYARRPNENPETPSANPLRMAASGAVRGWVSDPLLLAGVASAGLSAATKYLKGEEGGFSENFAKGLYKEGGPQKVAENLRQKQSELEQQHPEWSTEQIHRELLAYQATPKFFEFHTDQMAGAYGTGMKMAAAVNGLMGVPKTPEQQTWMDEASQVIGQVLVPSMGIFSKGVNYFAKALGATAPKAIEQVARVADIALPGTDSKFYNAAGLGTSIGGGLAINEATRAVTGQPLALTGEAFTPRDPLTGGPTTDPRNDNLGARPSDFLVAGAAGLGTAAMLARALGGRPRFDPNTVVGGASIADQRAGARTMAPVPEPGPIERLSAAINQWDPVEAFARDVADVAAVRAKIAGQAPNTTRNALEVDVQAAHGLEISTEARQSAFLRARDEGVLPNNVRTPVTIRQFEEAAQQVSPETLTKFSESIAAANVADVRKQGLQKLIGEAQAAPNDPDIAARLAARLADTPESRPAFQAWSDNDVAAKLNAAAADPEARQLLSAYATLNRSINELRYKSGLLTQETFNEYQKKPFHTPLFEFDSTKYDPSKPRTTTVDPANPGVVPNRTIDPFSAINLNMAQAVDEVKINDGKLRVINSVRGADPQEQFVKRIGPASVVDRRPEGTVSVMEGGREILYQFSSPAVADALKSQPLTLGPLATITNDIRRGFHWLTTGPILGGIPTATKSVIYDTAQGYVTQRPGRAFGYFTKWGRIAAGDNQLANQLIDTARAFDVSAPASVALAFTRMGTFRAIDALGRTLAAEGAKRNSILGALPTQWVQDAGAYLAQTAESSMYGMMKHADILQPHAMFRDAASTKNRYDAIIQQYAGAGRDPSVASRVNSVLSPWMGLLDNIYNSAKYAYFSNNMAVLRNKYGAQIPQIEIDRLAEETRRMAGDISAQGGSQLYREAIAGVPYGNIAMQSNRHLLHAMFAQGNKQSFDVGLRISLLGASAYAGANYVMSMGPEAKDWYWNKQNEWERVGTIPVPSGEAIQHRIKTGEWPKFDPLHPTANFERIKLSAELVPFTQLALAAAEKAGVLDRGANTAKSTIAGDISTGVAGSLNLGTHVALNTAGALAGQRLDFGNPLRGRGVASEIQGPKGEMGRTPGGIPVQAAEVAKALGGTGMDILIQTTDAGLQSYERGDGFVSALQRAGLEAKARLVDEKYITVPGFWKAADKVYLSNAEGQAVKKVEKAQKALDEAWGTEFGKGVATQPNAAKIQDPEVKQMLAITHQFLGTGGYRQLKDYRSQLEMQLYALEGQKDRYTPEKIAELKRRKQVEIQGVQSRMVPLQNRLDEILRQRFGPRFEREGLEPDVDGVATLVDRYRRKTPRQ